MGSSKNKKLLVSLLLKVTGGKVITESLSKAEILNYQFKSVFTPQSGNTFPQLPGTQFPKIKPLHISENDVFMLLDRIDVSKSSGPDKLPGRLLQSLANVAPGFVDRPRRSDCTAGQMDGEAGWWTTSGNIGLPPLARAMGVGRQQQWTQANVAPIFMKGSKLQAVNYCPVSLTCILFEHIICKHILAHLEDHKILTDLQHGFRS